MNTQLLTTHPVAGSMRASASITASAPFGAISRPPSARGIHIRNRPVSTSAAMTSGAIFRFASAAAA